MESNAVKIKNLNDVVFVKILLIKNVQFFCMNEPQGKNIFKCLLCTAHSPTSVNNTLGEKDKEIENMDIYHLNNQLRLKEVGNLFVLHLNIVSLVANFEIKSLISKTHSPPDLICISETD